MALPFIRPREIRIGNRFHTVSLSQKRELKDSFHGGFIEAREHFTGISRVEVTGHEVPETDNKQL